MDADGDADGVALGKAALSNTTSTEPLNYAPTVEPGRPITRSLRPSPFRSDIIATEAPNVSKSDTSRDRNPDVALPITW